jgi:hypothetical protein
MLPYNQVGNFTILFVVVFIETCGISGLMTNLYLARFPVTDNAVIQPGRKFDHTSIACAGIHRNLWYQWSDALPGSLSLRMPSYNQVQRLCHMACGDIHRNLWYQWSDA